MLELIRAVLTHVKKLYKYVAIGFEIIFAFWSRSQPLDQLSLGIALGGT